MKKKFLLVMASTFVLTGCGGVEKDATYESAANLREAVISSEVDCPGESVEADDEMGEEFIKCSDGLALSVFSNDADLSMAKGLYSMGTTSFLSGPNWLVQADDDSVLSELRDSLGGELTVP